MYCNTPVDTGRCLAALQATLYSRIKAAVNLGLYVHLMHIYNMHLVRDVGFCEFGALTALLRCFVESCKYTSYATES